MNIACSSCPAKYAVPDEKVRGRKVRITCKRCGAAIIVDGTSLAAGGAPDGTADRPPQQTIIGGVGTHTGPAEGASAASTDAAAAPKAEAASPAPVAQPAPGPTAAAAAGAAAKPPAASASEEATRAEPAAVVQAAARAALAGEQEPAPAPVAEKPAPKPVAIAKPLASVAKAAGSEAKPGGFPRPGGFGAKPAAATALKAAAAPAITATAAAAEAKPVSAATEPLVANADEKPAAAEADPPAPASPVAAPKPVFASPFRPMAKAPATAGAASPQPARATAAPRATATARAVAPNPLPERTWTVAVTDDTHREMTITQVVDAYAAQVIDAETFIWRDGMQDWLMPFEISEIAAALRARRLSPRTTAAARDCSLGEDGGHAGAWREPGRWDRDEPPPSEANFDDVTVAMEAPKAQALLQAVAASEERNAAPARKGDEPTAVVAASAVTPELLGFGVDDDGSKVSVSAVPKSDADAPKADEATSSGEERAVERLPFELAQGAAPARAALKSRSGEERAERPDLFAQNAVEAAAAPEGDESNERDAEPAAPAALTGARNESSVLFSLDQLSRVTDTQAPTKRAKVAKQREEDALLLGDAAGSGMQPVTGLGGGLFAPTTMAAPDFTAPPPPSVPPAAARSAVSNAPATAAKKSGAGIWIGVALVSLVAAGVVGFFVKGAAPPPAPSATPVAATETPPVTSLTASAPADSAAPSASGAPAGTAAPATSGSAATGAVPSAGAAVPAAAPTAPAAVAMAQRPQTAAAPKATAAAAEPAAAEGPDFDKDAAMAALATAAARAESECSSQEGTHGTGKVSVTFATSGRATNALVVGDFAGSALGGCVAKVFRSTRVPAFGGDAVRVSKTVRIP